MRMVPKEDSEANTIWPRFGVRSHTPYHAMRPKGSSPGSRLSKYVITPELVLLGSRLDDLPPIVHLPADDLPRQRQHLVVAAGVQPVLKQLPLDG